MKTRLSVGQVRLMDGVPSLITSGFFLDPTYGYVSNFWEWRPILKDGTLGEPKSGYGKEQVGELVPHTIRIELE